ncbi:MAG: hypothetical protein J6Y76_00635 [Paludibacteraceae bacterium]|nr:hypothetical protein [Paludibacteraceae bacterium]
MEKKYDWKFATIGGNTRVQLSSGEDIRHLGELDQKMWTVLSCPTKGFEMDETTLTLLDLDGDGHVKVNEIIAASEWLCKVLKTPDTLLAGKDVLKLDEIQDEAILAIAKEIADDKDEVALADVEAAIAAVTIDAQPLLEAPYAADIIAAYKETEAAYGEYFKKKGLEKIGLAAIDPEAPVPGIEEKKWKEMGAKIAEFEAGTAAANEANAAALAEGTAKYRDLRKLLFLNRDFYKLLCNYITFQDFYSPLKEQKAVFQAGTLIIDQRACHLCMRVQNAAAHGVQAPASGIYLLYCTCTNKQQGKTLEIVAAMTMGETGDLYVGKNAIFYDRDGLDYDAVITKIIDNPISIRQAFWSPYRRLAKWAEDLINKRAAEKDSKMMADATNKLETTATAESAEKKEALKLSQQFDIAKFAGIFAAIGMAVGLIGAALADFFSAFTVWWHWVVFFVVLLLIISGPSMIMAWLKLRRRNIGPLLNANGWAVNAASIINIPFGATLTDQVKFPIVKAKDPFAEERPLWKKCFWWLVGIAIVVCGLWLGNLLNFNGKGWKSPLKCFNKEVVEEPAEAPAEEAVAVEEVVAEEPAEAPAE